MIKLYRAVPKIFYEEGKILFFIKKRTPSNVPHLIDNLWEYLRPGKYPSSRFFAYASPTINLALQNASAAGHDRSEYVVNKVLFHGHDYKIAHIKSSDARYHSDCYLLKKIVIKHMGENFSNLSISEKVKHACLFISTIDKEELFSYFPNLTTINIY